MDKKSPLQMVAGILLVVGGLNWGLVGLGYFINTNLNLVNLLFGWLPALENVIYLVVAASAVVHAMSCMKSCECEKK